MNLSNMFILLDAAARQVNTYIASEIFLLAQNTIIDVQFGVK